MTTCKNQLKVVSKNENKLFLSLFFFNLKKKRSTNTAYKNKNKSKKCIYHDRRLSNSVFKVRIKGPLHESIQIPRKFYIRRNNNNVDSTETGRIVIAHLLP